MMPLDRCMDSFPHQMSQMHYTQHNHPGLENTPQMKIDPRRISASFDVWPYGGNYGYPFPCHGCCNHGYLPGYYSYRPPYPQFPQPFPINYHGAYPQVPEPYHVQFEPRQLYSMEQPRYEYEKNAAGNYHCCGCPNHTCNVANKNFKIEEQKPEFNEKSSELKNYPYPVVWFPPGYLKNKEHGKPFELIVKNWDEEAHEKKSQNQLGDNRNQLSLPNIWMPSDDRPEKAERKNNEESNASQESVEAWPSLSRVVPWKSPNSDGNEKILRANEDDSSNDVIESKMSEKSANRKSIPVKQMEPHDEIRMTLKGNETKGKDIHVMHADNSGTGKPSKSNDRRESSSPSKTSKLPPVCLRVDPLPRRKAGTGSSRSPSSPGHNKKSHEASDKTVDASALTSLKGNNQPCPQLPDHTVDKIKETEPNKKETRIIKVKEMPAEEKENVDVIKEKHIVNLQVGSHAQFTEARENLGRVAGQCEIAVKEGATNAEGMEHKGLNEETNTPSCHGDYKIDNNKEINQSTEGKSEEIFGMEKNKLSNEEAALIIQSVYRGYELRKWEPLKILKQLVKIQEQVADVTKSIQALQSSSNHQRDEKQRIILGETIMSLLLKLDTMQGLPPSLREVRKSVARELTRLQERLDSVSEQASEGYNKEASPELQDECANTNNDECERGNDKAAKEVKSGDEHTENSHCHSSRALDAIPTAQAEVNSEFLQDDEMNIIVETQVSNELETKMMEPELITECKDEEHNSQGIMPEIQGGKYETMPASLSEQSTKLPSFANKMPSSEMNFRACLGDGSAGEMNSQMVENDNSTLMDIDLERNSLDELPQEVVNEEVFIPPSEQQQNMESGEDEVLLMGGQIERMPAACVEQVGGHFESNMEIGVRFPENGALGVKLDPCVAEKEGPHNPNSVKLNLPDDKEVFGNANVKVELVQGQIDGSHDNQQISEAEKENCVMEKESHSEDPSGPEVSEFENCLMDVVESRMAGEQLPGENFSPNHEPVEAFEAEPCQPAFFAVDNEIYSEKHEGHELHDANRTSPEPIFMLTSQENEIPVGEAVASLQVPVVESQDHLDKLMATRGETGKEGEVMQEEKVQYEELESEPGNVKWLDGLHQFETAKDKELVRSFSAPVVVKQDEEKGEVSPTSSTISHATIEEITESENKLVEENTKLRELIEKLIEAGKEQLTVISSLNERVKDLEKKLPKKKKSTRTRRYRAPKVPASACINFPNDYISIN